MPSDRVADAPFTWVLDQDLRILVIDDDRKLCRLIQGYLEPLGYGVQAAHTGPEGA